MTDMSAAILAERIRAELDEIERVLERAYDEWRKRGVPMTTAFSTALL